MPLSELFGQKVETEKLYIFSLLTVVIWVANYILPSIMI